MVVYMHSLYVLALSKHWAMCIGHLVAAQALLLKEAVLHTSQIMPGTRLALELHCRAAHMCMPQGQKAATASAETLADQLMAEEAQAAARAASKKIKKQKAKARKQQARSEDTTAASSTVAAAAASADANVAEDPQASSVAVELSQLGLTHVSASPDSAASAAAEVAAVTHPDKAAGLSAAEDQASNLHADDKFLQDLFRCPITKVSCPLALEMQLDKSKHAQGVGNVKRRF